jgi:hypothetical protein
MERPSDLVGASQPSSHNEKTLMQKRFGLWNIEAYIINDAPGGTAIVRNLKGPSTD